MLQEGNPFITSLWFGSNSASPLQTVAPDGWNLLQLSLVSDTAAPPLSLPAYK